jgi:hypothetical protein
MLPVFDLYDDRLDCIRAANTMNLQLETASTTPAPGPSTREESSSAGPVTAVLAPETVAPEGSVPAEPAPGADATLPDLLPPELQLVEAGAGGKEQVEAPGAAPMDGTGKRMTAPASFRDPHAVC